MTNTVKRAIIMAAGKGEECVLLQTTHSQTACKSKWKTND